MIRHSGIGLETTYMLQACNELLGRVGRKQVCCCAEFPPTIDLET